MVQCGLFLVIIQLSEPFLGVRTDLRRRLGPNIVLDFLPTSTELLVTFHEPLVLFLGPRIPFFLLMTVKIRYRRGYDKMFDEKTRKRVDTEKVPLRLRSKFPY